MYRYARRLVLTFCRQESHSCTNDADHGKKRGPAKVKIEKGGIAKTKHEEDADQNDGDALQLLFHMNMLHIVNIYTDKIPIHND